MKQRIRKVCCYLFLSMIVYKVYFFYFPDERWFSDRFSSEMLVGKQVYFRVKNGLFDSCGTRLTKLTPQQTFELLKYEHWSKTPALEDYDMSVRFKTFSMSQDCWDKMTRKQQYLLDRKTSQPGGLYIDNQNRYFLFFFPDDQLLLLTVAEYG